MTGRGPDDDQPASAADEERRYRAAVSDLRADGGSNGDGGPDRGRRTRRRVRPGREHLWRFLRALIGLFLLTSLLSALFVPVDPLPFLVALVPLWVLSVPLAWYLVYRDGYDRLRASGLYDPGVPTGRAVAAFVVVAAVLKVLGTMAGVALVRAGPGGVGGTVADVVDAYTFAVDVAISLVALAVAYVLVFRQPFGQSSD